ncbi:M14 family metallopeptidase [Kordiimonas lipolytica]|uniref:M14 family metallopeptidase n=1 Tax=Kordiimonas lipolytica TaxID=1662421 RepID=A0ABV8UC39_9PROT|nr:M14 family metallopeptidase [Kordiimonas lipolytica]
MLQTYDQIPDELLTCSVSDLAAILGGPALFYLEGQRKPPLFVTVLQHGNEPTGFEAVQAILKKYGGGLLPRAMWLFIGNVAAAKTGERVLPGQLDYNRAWPGTDMPKCAETSLMEDVVSRVTAEPLFASIDLHNNTGCNPHYGCVNVLDTAYLQLASLFSRTVVYFTRPLGVQSAAMAQHVPSVTLECGQAGQYAALTHAIEYLDACLHLHHIPDHPVAPHDIHLLKTMATVKVKAGLSFDFSASGSDICFRTDLDHFNFGLLKSGEAVAQLREGLEMPVFAVDESGADITSDLFVVSSGLLKARNTMIPSMATTNVDVVRQDCLFYVMEEIAMDA